MAGTYVQERRRPIEEAVSFVGDAQAGCELGIFLEELSRESVWVLRARLRLELVRYAARGEDADDFVGLDQVRRDWSPLGFVGGEDGGAVDPLEYASELPCDVDGVVDSIVHSLGGGARMRVRSVYRYC